MRISDWSSDVCSSDLGKTLVQHRELAVFRAKVVTPLRHAMRLVDGEETDVATFQQPQESFGQQPFGRHIDEIDRARAHPPFDVARLVAIGRASCRERVCQYV